MIVVCSSCASQNRVPAARLNAHARCGSCKTALCPLDRPLVVSSEADFDELVADAPLPVVVDFWAAWCGPCRAVAPELVKLAHAKAGMAIVAKVDTEAIPELSARNDVRGIPTMVVFRGGRETKRVSGAMSAARIADALGL